MYIISGEWCMYRHRYI